MKVVTVSMSTIEAGTPCGKSCSQNPQCLNEVRLASSLALDAAWPCLRNGPSVFDVAHEASLQKFSTHDAPANVVRRDHSLASHAGVGS